ncbi:hypothetical protein PC128_g14511 [Phytophthora cactorum]|nr:hypothetical protein PC120_g18532 [Phytophthora cactorum]KAG3047922.1 hypothetical protein PC121_g19779 [Phytophthora cactorum]KAG3182847.1 hypothetical protein PC128_g14511 [Phytophthora cactorum]KAG4039120.1 hypothetical protein PC123_g25325 [Phytophthora cactorum]
MQPKRRRFLTTRLPRAGRLRSSSSPLPRRSPPVSSLALALRPIQHPNIIRAAYAPAGALRFSNAQHILVATYSAWFGRYGITIMHYLRADRAAQVRAGSSDANYSLDFSANVVPPQPPS